MEKPVVIVTQGKLCGDVKTLSDGSQFYSFKGIPYAQSPVGKLRFKAPLPPKPWKDTFNAIDHGSVCPHIEMLKNHILEGDEDCLFLNVYSKSLDINRCTPVMVYIHGGAFLEGSGDAKMYGPDFIVENDVVLVTINYRLEVFGFLCLDTPEVPGNAGMKDQIAALRWVRDNIKQFGGDPNNVTIFGESAGSASVTHHLLSPTSKGLFHKVIAQSGVCASDWAVRDTARDLAFRVGKIFGKNTEDANELLEFLRTVPSKNFINMTTKILSDEEILKNVNLLFVPVIEKKFDCVEPFITENPLSVLSFSNFNKVPLMIGYTSSEGLLFVSQKMQNIHVYNEKTEYNVPDEIRYNIPLEKAQEFGDEIKKFYTEGNGFSKDRIEEISHHAGDIAFAYSIHRFTHKYSRSLSQVFMYRFNYDTDLNIFKKVTLKLSGVKGASHADDLFYLFHNEEAKALYSRPDLKKHITKVTKLWTNFAKYGNPTPDSSFGVQWPMYTTEHKEFVNIDEILSIGEFADRERIQFWDKLYREVGLPSLET